MANNEINDTCGNPRPLVGKVAEKSTQKTLLGYRLHENLIPDMVAELFEKCRGKCTNTGECTADCPEYPAEEVIDLLENRILQLKEENERLKEFAQ
jgi:hypothetical protein